MSYIGAKPTIGNFQICDAISVVNGQAAYTMQVGSVNVIPQSSNHMIVSLNGVIQKPGGANPSFTVSGATITFSSNLATGDVINFIQILGDVLDLGVPSDATVTNAKTNFVSTSSAAGLQIKGDGTTDGTLQLNCSQNSHGIKLKSPAHSASASYTLTFPTTDGNANEFLQSNGSGVLTWAEAGGGKIAQYKHDYDSASIGLSNTSWTDTNLSIAFTPTASGNRIVLKGMVQVYVDGAPSYYGNMEYRVLNGSSVIMEGYSVYTGYGGTEALFNGMLPFNVYETTAGSTSERTYKVQVRNTDTNSGAHYNQYSGYSALEVWEIDY